MKPGVKKDMLSNGSFLQRKSGKPAEGGCKKVRLHNINVKKLENFGGHLLNEDDNSYWEPPFKI